MKFLIEKQTLGEVRALIEEAIKKYGENAECMIAGCYDSTGVIEEVEMVDGVVYLVSSICSG